MVSYYKNHILQWRYNTYPSS